MFPRERERATAAMILCFADRHSRHWQMDEQFEIKLDTGKTVNCVWVRGSQWELPKMRAVLVCFLPLESTGLFTPAPILRGERDGKVDLEEEWAAVSSRSAWIEKPRTGRSLVRTTEETPMGDSRGALPCGHRGGRWVERVRSLRRVRRLR